MAIECKSFPDQHYIYVEREASFSADAIAAAMGNGFGAVFGFVQSEGVAPLSMPACIYLDMPSGDKMAFRAAVFVSAEDAAKADGEVKSSLIPAGDVYMTTHTGPYAMMSQTHKMLWGHMSEQGIKKAMPVWEIYIDDPEKTAEENLRTEIYRAVSS